VSLFDSIKGVLGKKQEKNVDDLPVVERDLISGQQAKSNDTPPIRPTSSEMSKEEVKKTMEEEWVPPTLKGDERFKDFEVPKFDEPVPELGNAVAGSKPQKEVSLASEELRSKIDLILTKLENLKMQNENLEERIRRIERILAEMRGIRYY